MRQIFCRHSFPYVPFTFVNHPGSQEKFISLERHSPYELAFSELIMLMHELSAVLWVHIAVFESTLRSFIHKALSAEYKTTNWWEESSLLTKRELKRINGFKRIYLSKKRTTTNIQFQEIPSLGFWLTLISNKYGHRIWRHIENHNPALKSYGRRNFQQKAVIIRDLRNAIAHHAPILHRNLERDLTYIQELISLLSPPLAESLRNRSNVLNLINQLNEIPRVRSH